MRPNLGVIEFPDLRKITIADLPGLIEGAHRNVGLGHSFLKHVERTKLLLFLVDINGFRLSPHYPHRSPLETLSLLIRELELYGRDILSKPALLVVNKMDTEGSDKMWENLEKSLSDFEGLLYMYCSFCLLTCLLSREHPPIAGQHATKPSDKV